jgi:hypothetical protein
VPVVTLSSAGCDDGIEVGPRLSNQFRLLVVVEDGDLEAMVVGRVVDGEAQFLVPVLYVNTCLDALGRNTYHLGVWPPRLSVLVFFASLPSRAAQYGSCLPMAFLFGSGQQWSSAVEGARVRLTYIGEVFGTINDGHQGANDRPVD